MRRIVFWLLVWLAALLAGMLCGTILRKAQKEWIRWQASNLHSEGQNLMSYLLDDTGVHVSRAVVASRVVADQT